MVSCTMWSPKMWMDCTFAPVSPATTSRSCTETCLWKSASSAAESSYDLMRLLLGELELQTPVAPPPQLLSEAVYAPQPDRSELVVIAEMKVSIEPNDEIVTADHLLHTDGQIDCTHTHRSSSQNGICDRQRPLHRATDNKKSSDPANQKSGLETAGQCSVTKNSLNARRSLSVCGY
mmetsp:Transcript_35996/g.90315  ORF Transcript_35996/g.90315 Transcript_35996/m.90315 type:complete len:177 (-) Transcript_35996:39-569(-)